MNNSDIPLNTNTLIRAYSFSPYGKYEELTTLGEGSYALVKKVCLKYNKLIIRAMKKISKKQV